LPQIAALSGYIRRVLQEFRTPKMGVILLLGFSSGLPLYLTSRTLQAWMTVAGVNLTSDRAIQPGESAVFRQVPVVAADRSISSAFSGAPEGVVDRGPGCSRRINRRHGVGADRTGFAAACL